KVNLASMHLEGKAAQWFQNLSKKCGDLSWAQFLEFISARFEELKESKIIGEFNKLRHLGSYGEYVEKLEELKACMLCLNKDFTEEYFIASFISGLSEELQSFINMFQPVTLQQTIDLGKKQLVTLEAITKKLRNTNKTYTNNYPSPRKNEFPYNQQPKNNQNPQKNQIRLLTPAEMAARRDKGLCYNCDEQYTYGHRCKHRLNYMVMTEEEEGNYLKKEEPPEEENLDTMEEIQMSLNSITGEVGLTTMRVCGGTGEHKLHILIDSGSTLSFIQASTAEKLQLPLKAVKPIAVRVANGQRMLSSHIVDGFKWKMQGHTFSYPLRVLDNEGCDMILGGDWLKSCTPVELDYEKMHVGVNVKGKR
ncbi:Unknown protein, partial [Striga hermonthica]